MLDEDQQKVFDAVVTGKHGKLILMSKCEAHCYDGPNRPGRFHHFRSHHP
jgi:hypothetical protein